MQNQNKYYMQQCLTSFKIPVQSFLIRCLLIWLENCTVLDQKEYFI